MSESNPLLLGIAIIPFQFLSEHYFCGSAYSRFNFALQHFK
jgi:hypothetical protein